MDAGALGPGCTISPMEKALVTGGTGFVGKYLCALINTPNVLTRRPETAPRELRSAACFRWNPNSELPPSEAFEGCEAVFHLAGEPVAEGRWTARKKARIRDSRVHGTRNLVEALGALDRPPSVLVSASAVGIYGSRQDEVLDEGSKPASGFLADVCRAWEAESMAAERLGMRVVIVRIGLVLGKSGGALAKLLPLFRICGGGRLGNGRQWMPWIRVDDLARLLLYAAETNSLRGPVNGAAPHPVRNSDFTRALARAVRRPALLPAPAFGLRLALGEFAEVLLASQRVIPRAATNAGFRFRFPTMDSALADL